MDTFVTFQEDRLWLNAAAFENAFCKVVTLLVFQAEMVGLLPVEFCNKPLIFVTPLTSHVPRLRDTFDAPENREDRFVTVDGMVATDVRIEPLMPLNAPAKEVRVNPPQEVTCVK